MTCMHTFGTRTEGLMKFNVPSRYYKTITGQEENKEMLQHVDALPSKVHVGIVYTHITSRRYVQHHVIQGTLHYAYRRYKK